MITNKVDLYEKYKLKYEEIIAPYFPDFDRLSKGEFYQYWKYNSTNKDDCSNAASVDEQLIEIIDNELIVNISKHNGDDLLGVFYFEGLNSNRIPTTEKGIDILSAMQKIYDGGFRFCLLEESSHGQDWYGEDYDGCDGYCTEYWFYNLSTGYRICLYYDGCFNNIGTEKDILKLAYDMRICDFWCDRYKSLLQ